MAGLFESPVKSIKDLPDLKYYPIFDKRSWSTPIEAMVTPPKRAKLSFKSTPKTETPKSSRKILSNKKENKSNQTPKTSKLSRGSLSDNESPNSSTSGKRANTSRKGHYNHREQYTLDFGQRSSESTHQCRVCSMFYVPNEIDDEKQHKKFHDIQIKGIPYTTPWKNEVVLKEYQDGKVILIRSGSNQRKLEQLFSHVTEELGLCIDLNSLRQHSLLLLFISYQNSKRIVGLLTGERIKEAFRLLNDEPLRCSTESVPAEFGISIIWVHRAYRRQKICWRLFEVFCQNVSIKDRNKLALSQPSLAVINFVRKFLNADQLLVYEMEYFKTLE